MNRSETLPRAKGVTLVSIRGAVRRTLLLLFYPVQTVPWRVLMVMSPQKSLDGFDVRDLTGTVDSSRRFDSIEAALALIASIDARRYARMKQDLKRFLVLETGGPEYWPHLSACMLTPITLQRDVVELAMTIVHEATHARLHRRGVRYSPELRARIERICVTAEIAFARHLPGTEHLVENIKQDLSEPWWSATDLFERKMRRLRELGCPEWFVRTVRFVLAP